MGQFPQYRPGEIIMNDGVTMTNGDGLTNYVTMDNSSVICAMYCMDCFSMKKEKVPAMFLGYGFSLCEEHASKFLENQKKVHHESWMKANGKT